MANNHVYVFRKSQPSKYAFMAECRSVVEGSTRTVSTMQVRRGGGAARPGRAGQRGGGGRAGLACGGQQGTRRGRPQLPARCAHAERLPLPARRAPAHARPPLCAPACGRPAGQDAGARRAEGRGGAVHPSVHPVRAGRHPHPRHLPRAGLCGAPRAPPRVPRPRWMCLQRVPCTLLGWAGRGTRRPAPARHFGSRPPSGPSHKAS